ncbi:MAG: hypothetical protein H6859_04650 [Rhodospirillales bacterium]|nr:hypothetical protein [Alphaproteobacteria bacterium]USO06473.1 MAG: hypothetical protein H6859_04650 [Rhodospirillales bacterium]
MITPSPIFLKPIVVVAALLVLIPAQAVAKQKESLPSLVITNEPLPKNLQRQIYSRPAQVRTIKPQEVLSDSYFKPSQTLVGRKIGNITSELARIQNSVAGLSGNLNGLERVNEERAAEYYANIATINTQLQSGTTPGNPRLVKRLDDAEGQLETLSSSMAKLNGMAVETSNIASEASFLLEEARAAYSLSGAIEEDHVHLAQVEDAINNTLILIERVLNTISDDMTRTSTYLSSERENLRLLGLAVANGEFYGRSLAKRPFSGVSAYDATLVPSTTSADPVAPAASLSSGPRPLAKIKFDRPDVAYEEPIYLAINEALKRYPNARFDLVAVTPMQGNAAQIAIESTKARRNAEKVLRTLTQMGLPHERIDLSYNKSAQAVTNEVHLFVK